MAEALAVAGVVSNIVQLVDFGSKVLGRLDDFQSSLGETPKVFRHIKTELPILLDTLKQTKLAVEKGSVKDETKNALIPVVDGCRAQIELLDGIIGKVVPLTGDSWRRKGSKAIASLWQDSKVKNITAVLRNYIQTLTYYHAASSSRLHVVNNRPSVPSTPSSTVPFRRDRDFVYRDILSEIERRCSQPASRVALVGLGGVGKSQLAIEYSYLVREKSPTMWVFWVHASNTTRFEEGYRRIAERVDIPGWENPETDILKIVNNWLSNEANGQWLMIIDNADDASVFPQQVDLPQSHNGSILVTSRNRDMAYKITGDTRDIIVVDPMDEGYAMELLRKKLQDPFDAIDGKRLLQALDFMPLAITQAAAFISQRSPHSTVATYLRDLQKSDSERARLLNKNITDNRRDGRSSNSIIATWHISFENIQKERPSAARLLSLMCLFDRQGIPKSLLDHRYQDTDEIDNDFFDEDVYTLCSYSLIGTNIDATEFEMHRLVQFSTKTWLELRGGLEKWKEKFIVIMVENFPVGRYENWRVCQNLFPHAEAVLAYRPKNEEHLRQWALVLFRAAWYADDKGYYDVAEEMSKQAIDAQKRVLGPEHPSTLTSMASLALTYNSQGRWKDAEQLGVQVVEIRKRVLGTEHPDTLTSMATLATTYRYQGRWKEAEELQAKELEICSRVQGTEHLDTLTSMDNLASTYRDQGRWKEAEELQVQVVETRQRVLGAEHPDTLTSMHNLALTYSRQGRLKEAEELQVQVVEMSQRMQGAEHPYTLTSMNNLALTYRNQGRLKEAEEIQVQVMETRQRVQGAEHPYTLTSMHNLALTYSGQGRWKEAEELQAKELEICSRVQGAEHPDTLTSMHNLASTYHDQGRLKEAEELQVQVMETMQRVLGAEHPSTLTSMHNLASAYRDQGRLKEAEELQVQVVETRQRVLGAEHPHTLTSMSNLAMTYRHHGRWKGAEQLEVQVMETRQRVLGVGHPDTLTSINNLALTVKDQHRNQEALGLMRKCAQLRAQVIGLDHPDTISSRDTLNEWEMEGLDLQASEI